MFLGGTNPPSNQSSVAETCPANKDMEGLKHPQGAGEDGPPHGGPKRDEHEREAAKPGRGAGTRGGRFMANGRQGRAKAR